MNYNFILGFVAATLTTIAFAPQAIRCIKQNALKTSLF
jgi:uncharacterized protein with PQ loop repeat